MGQPSGISGLKLAFVFWVPVQLPPPSLSSSPMVHGWLLSVWGGFLLFVLFSVSHQPPSMQQRNSTDPRLQMLGDSLLGQGQEQEGFWLLLGLGGGLWCCPQALQQVLVPRCLLVAVGLCPLAGHELGVPRCPVGSSAPFSSAFSIGSHLGADRAPAPAIQAAEPGPADDPVRRPPPCCRETPHTHF